MLTNDLPPPRASYVYQRNALFYFRFTFPLKISRLVGKRELRYSLRTGYRHSAVRRAMGLVVQVERFVWQLQKDSAMTQLSPQHLQTLLDQHMRATLNQYEEQRIVSTQPLSHEDVENAGLVWDYLAEDTQDQLARNDYSRVSLGTNVLLEANSIRLDPDSVEYRRFCRELLKTEARLIHIEQLRNQGKYDQLLENEILLPASPALPSLPDHRDWRSTRCANRPRHADSGISGRTPTNLDRKNRSRVCGHSGALPYHRGQSAIGAHPRRLLVYTST